MDEIKELIEQAKQVANSNNCCKCSNFTVGAVLVSKSGKRYNGFNIENLGLQSICAERTAFCNALVNLENEFEKIVVVAKNRTDEKFTKTLPCGYCRQFLIDYATRDLEIITCDDIENKIYTYTLGELLPEAYDGKQVNF